MVGRTAHEVVQVKSILYPWGIRSCARSRCFASAAATSIDSTPAGRRRARASSIFASGTSRMRMTSTRTMPIPSKRPLGPTQIHPGTVKGLFNVQNIRTAIGDVGPFTGSMDITSLLRGRCADRHTGQVYARRRVAGAGRPAAGLLRCRRGAGKRRAGTGERTGAGQEDPRLRAARAARHSADAAARSSNSWCASSVRSAGRSPASWISATADRNSASTSSTSTRRSMPPARRRSLSPRPAARGAAQGRVVEPGDARARQRRCDARCRKACPFP